ncbi:hypothetical protein [Pseudomonas huaxiensis]|uniref:hypothetical protein n=1 Tax=Pseudomonas huaxiensis TaxID=2213017 RepID=UPI000DA6489C|nr:hypothetical protein [Pseudomonas huaxiensis]
MNSVIGRLLTGVCGGLVMAAVNHWNTLTGWAYAGSIAAAFIAFFLGAVLLEHRAAKKPAAAKQGIGSFNEAEGDQEIEIERTKELSSNVNIGSSNKSGGNQKIKIG